MAVFNIGDAIVDTGVDLDGLDEGIEDANEKAASGFSKIGDTIGSALKVGVAAAGVAVVAAIGAIGVAAFDTASQVAQASNDIQAELGVTEEEANRLGDVALKVWGENWGDSIDDVKTGIVTVRQQMKGLADEDLEAVTAKAFAIRDAFGVDVAESTNAANVLMEKFGLNSTEAFDFISKGFQKGLNNSGDFLESIGEYSVQFSDAGFDAQSFFSIMETGQQAGVLGTDKAADAIKEFRIRFEEAGEGTFQALQKIGVDTDGLLEKMETGQISTADAFTIVQDALRNTDNQVYQNTAGVALFGTQWEDLGPTAVLAIDAGKTSLEDMAGATDSLNAKYDNWPAMWEGIKRSALVAIEPLGGKLLELANDVMPIVQVGFDWLKNDLPPIIETVVGVIDAGVAFITELFNGPLAGSLTENATFFQTTFSQVSEIVNTTIELIMVVVGALVGFFQAHRTEIMAIVGNTWNSVQALISGVLSLISGILKAFLLATKGDFSGAWEAIKQGSAAFVSGLLTAFRNGLDNLKIIFQGPINWIVEQWEALPGRVAGVGAAIVTAIQSEIEREWGRLVDWFNGKLEELRNLLPFSEPKDPSSPLRGLSKSGEAIVGMLMDGMESMIPALGSVIQTVGETMRSKVTKMTEEIADEIQKTVEDLQKKAEEVENAITAAMIGGFGADADIARLKARNLDAVSELGEASRAEAQKQLDLAGQMAAEFSDPEQAADFFKERSRQILELAQLQDELSAAETEADKTRLKKKIDLIKLAQEAEQSALSLQEPNTALGGVIAALEGFLMDESVRNNMPGILDDPTGTLRGLTELLGQLRGANTTPDYTAGAMVFNIDARGSTMTAAEYEASMRKVLNETGRSADWRRRTGGS